jgi:hypothetical protein
MASLSHRFWLLASLCALFGGALLLPGLGGSFLLDDPPTITENAAVTITTLDAASLVQAASGFVAGGGSRALPMLTFALNYWWNGPDPAAFKAVNIAIHALTTLSLAVFFRLLLTSAGWPSQRTALVAPALALAWAIHPLQVSSVLYVVQRMQTLGTLFLVLALWAYLKMRLAQIDGARSRQYGMLASLCWALALACKEDSVLLPAYTLALELTVLRFRSMQPELAQRLRRGYLLACAAAALVFLFFVLPHYWSWEHYRYRDFSSSERLLTQARVLAMYLGQILWPLPSHLPFYYDDLQPSRGLLQPWTTLPSLLLVVGLLELAWFLRQRRPLFALGIFLFFAGHAVSSNIIGLELAFEHRNHFPLIGAVLAIGDLLAAAYSRLRPNARILASACTVIFVALGLCTWQRAEAWGSPLGFARYSARIAPHSERALGTLCSTTFDLSTGKPGTPFFDEALAACNQGANLSVGASALTSLVLLKTIDGSVRQSDWDRLFQRMRTVTMSPSNIGIIWHIIRYSSGDPRIDPSNVLTTLDIIANRAEFRPEEYAAFGYYALKNQLDDDALRYFIRAVQYSPTGSGLPAALVADLRREGLIFFAERIQAVMDNKT